MTESERPAASLGGNTVYCCVGPSVSSKRRVAKAGETAYKRLACDTAFAPGPGFGCSIVYLKENNPASISMKRPSTVER